MQYIYYNKQYIPAFVILFWILFFADHAVHSLVDIVLVDRAGQRSRTGGTVVQ